MNNKSKWDSLTLKEKSEVMKMAISLGVMDLDNIKSSYNSFAEGGPTEKPTFEEYYQSLPKDKRDTVNYNLRRAYELYPYEYMVKFAKDPNYHLGTVAYNKDTDEYEFLKGKNHNTVQKEIDWYQSNDSDAIEHRKNWKLDTSGDTYKYIRKNKFYTGGMTEEPEEEYVPATAAGFIAKQFGASPETQAAWDIGSATFNISSDSIPVIGNIAGMVVSAGDAIYDIGKFIADPNWGNASDVGTSLLSIIPGLDIKEAKSLYKAGKQTVKNATKVGVKEAVENTVKTKKHGQKKSYIYELYPNKVVRGDRVYIPSPMKTFGTLGNISDTTEDYLIGIEGLMNR